MTPPSKNTRSCSRLRADKNKPPTRDVTASSKTLYPSSNRQLRETSSKRRSGLDYERLGVLDMHAAEAGLDQAHIIDHPEWRLMDMSEGLELAGEDMEGVDEEYRAIDTQYMGAGTVTLYRLSEEGSWLDLGSGTLTLEASLYSSRATVRMAQTQRVLACWSIFGGMKVLRFLTTVIVVAIVPKGDDAQDVVSYGLKVDTLEQAKELAILLSSTSRGMQANLERLIPRLTVKQRANILESMADRLLVLQRRLGALGDDNELSVQVESELAGMLAAGIGLKQ